MLTETQRDYHERILRVLVHIQQHLDEPLRLDELAEIALFSPFHFHRIFRGLVGESVQAHVRRLRLERAAYRLKFTDLPVTAIAFEAGYEAHEAFTRAFHTMFGVAPTAFRTEQQNLPLPTVPSGIHYQSDQHPTDFSTTASGATPMQAEIRTLAPQRVAFMRHIGPYQNVGQTWMNFMQWAGMHGLCGPNTRCFGLAHDDPEVTPPDKIRYDACLVVDERFTPSGDVGVQTVAGGDYAVVMHCGPYEKLADTYAWLCGRWIPEQGRRLRAAPSFEAYLNNPQNTAPADLRTEVCVPLE